MLCAASAPSISYRFRRAIELASFLASRIFGAFFGTIDNATFLKIAQNSNRADSIFDCDRRSMKFNNNETFARQVQDWLAGKMGR
jgi:hypothetical protein